MAWIVNDTHTHDIHVMPHEDYRPHFPSRDCWCKPVEDELDAYGQVVLHNSLDGREQTMKEGGTIPLH